MKPDLVRVILLATEPGRVELVRSCLAERPDRPVELTVHAPLDEIRARLAESPPDLLLLDLPLPDGAGPATLTALLTAAPEVPALVLLDGDEPDLVADCIQRGAQDCLSARRLGGWLAETIHHTVQRHTLQRQLEAARTSAEEKINHLNQVLLAIRNVNQMIVTEKSPSALIQRACELLIETRGYLGAWIGLREREDFCPRVAEAGWTGERGYLEALYCSGCEPPCATRARTAPAGTVCLNPTIDCLRCPLNDRYGQRQAVSVLLRHGTAEYGCLGVAFPDHVPVGDDEVDLLREVAGDIAFALHTLEQERRGRQREEQYRWLIESMNEGVAIFEAVEDGRDYLIRDVNPSAERICRLTRNEMIGRTVGECFPGIVGLGLLEVFRRVVLTGRSEHLPAALYTDERLELWVENHVYRLADGRIAAVFNDVTEQQRSERRYRELFDSMLDGFASDEIILDEAGQPRDYRFLAVNPAFERLTGLRAAEVVGRTVREVLPDTEEAWIEDYGRVALTGESLRFERHAEALGKWFEVHAFRPAPGQFAVIFQDITPRREAEAARERLEAQLRQSQKLESIGRLAGGIAHDFNNMLQTILGYSSLALDELDPADEQREVFQEIHRAAERSAELTRQLLAFARRQTIQPRALNLNETIGGMQKMLARLIGEDIELLWRPFPELWPVVIDPSQVDQILANLCVNARDAIDGIGTVTIETWNVARQTPPPPALAELPPGDWGAVAVSDTGCGIPPELLEVIFEPFVTTKPAGEGTGLGLAMVYGAVKQNHGAIDVTSEPGRGTRFTIYLPRSTAAPGSPTEARRRPRPRGTETILLVEDEQVLLRMTRRLLSGLGYRVLAAAGPDEALALAETDETIDLLVTDVVMPQLNGRELAEQLQRRRPGLKCLFTSGYTADVLGQRGLLEESVQFIQKPYTVTDLAAKIRAVLDD